MVLPTVRTPITVISGHAQSLQAELPQRASETRLGSGWAERLGELLTVMLDFARSDAGRLTLQLESLDPELVLLTPMSGCKLWRQSAAVGAVLGAENLLVTADAERLQQCLAALVDNALRYSAGAVCLAVSASDDGVIFYIRDQGPGISEQERVKFLSGLSAATPRSVLAAAASAWPPSKC